MQAYTFAFAAAFAAACTQPRSTAVTAPTASQAPGTASQPPALDEGASQAAEPDAGTHFRSCTLDSECIAVDRVGCCHNGWKEAVAAPQAEAYKKSFTCPQENPMCPMYLVQDARVPVCDGATHLCTMTRPEDIACDGVSRNKHACPDGYRCQPPKGPDASGTCSRQP